MDLPLTALSLFSGAGGDTLGLERAGFKVLAFNEFNKAAIETHVANFPDSELICEKTITDITKLPDAKFEPYKDKIGVIFAGFPCFVKGTLVLTNSGYKPIEEVNLSDTLLTHTGKFQRPLNLQRKVYSGDLYSIRLKYRPHTIQATEEHPFYVRESSKKWNAQSRKYETQFGEPKWKNSKDLTENDYFGMVVNTESKIPSFTVLKNVNSNRTDTLTVTPEKEDEWFMMGYFLGDGWIEDTVKTGTNRPAHKIRFSIHTKDHESVLKRIQTVIPITNKNCSTGPCDKYGCADVAWYTILKQFQKYAHLKTIPEWVQDAPVHLIREFLNGYIAADGNSRADGTTSITTVSSNIALGVQRLYLKLGHIAGISRSEKSPSYMIEGRVVNQRDTFTIRVKEDVDLSHRSSFIEGAYAWLACASISKEVVQDEMVYNFEVEHDNSYIVENTIVHNCQGFSHAGKKKVNDPRNQMFRHFVRVVRIVRPKYFIGENVVGLRSMKSGPNEDDPLMLDLIIQAFREIGYELTHQVLEATDYGVPQKRKRILLIGWDTKRTTIDPTSFWASVAGEGAKNPLPKMSSFVRAVLDDAYTLKPDEIPEGFDGNAILAPSVSNPTGKPHPFIVLKAGEKLLSCTKRDSPVHSEVLNLNNPCKTIICTYDHQPRLLVGLKNKNGSFVRCLLPDEMKQIQGFPADFKLYGTMKEKIVQVGNAVPPPFVTAVATSLKNLG